MGLFNFLYKLSMIFTNKKRLKFFIVASFVILIIFACSRGVFAAEPTPEETQALTYYQLVLQENVIDYLKLMYQTKPNGFDNSAFNTLVTAMTYHNFWVDIPTGDPNCMATLYFYNAGTTDNNPNIFNVEGTWSIGLNSGTEYNCLLGNITPRYACRVMLTGGGRTTPIFNDSPTSHYMPSAFYMVRSTYVNEFLEEMGKLSSLNTTYSTNDDELQAITSARF